MPIGLCAGLIRFGEIETEALRVLDVELLHEIKRPLAQGLTDGVKEDEDQIRQLSCTLKKRIGGTSPWMEPMTHGTLPSHWMASFTSKGYFMSPSTRPGVSTNVTRLNFFCLDVEISVVR